MKMLWYALMLLSFASCKKDDVTDTLRDKLEGSWELRSRTSMSGQLMYPPGNGEILKFYRNGMYERKMHDIIAATANYDINIRQDCFPRETNFAFTSSESSSGLPAYVSIKGDTLFFSSPNCYADGLDTYYQRLP